MRGRTVIIVPPHADEMTVRPHCRQWLALEVALGVVGAVLVVAGEVALGVVVNDVRGLVLLGHGGRPFWFPALGVSSCG